MSHFHVVVIQMGVDRLSFSTVLMFNNCDLAVGLSVKNSCPAVKFTHTVTRAQAWASTLCGAFNTVYKWYGRPLTLFHHRPTFTSTSSKGWNQRRM
jgi:hypothetical protein